MKVKIYFFTSFVCLTLGCAYGSNYSISKKALRAHVSYLSADGLQGRQTGSEGENLAVQYAANRFKQLGLEPAGDHGTFLQAFDFTTGVSLGDNNTLSIVMQNETPINLSLDKDWRPLSFSVDTSFATTNLVFAGYGIAAPTSSNLPAYDSYRGLNVKDKWVVVLRYMPEKIRDEVRHQLNQYSSLRYKAFTAAEHGAKGIIFVSGPNSKVKNELIPLSFDTSLSNSGIVAISVTDAIANRLLTTITNQSNALQTYQDKLDLGQQMVVPALSGIKISGQIDIQKKVRQGHNVVARLVVDKAAVSNIVIGAHIDHLGRGELSGSRLRNNDTNQIHNGADDNASGVASVLEAAAKLSALKAKGALPGNKNILFALWSGEEVGLLGSSHYLSNLNDKTNHGKTGSRIDAYINLDMVGRFKKNLVVQGVGSSSRWKKLIAQTNQRHPISLITQNDPYLPTDSTAFYLHSIPAINLFTGSHDEYHTPRDKIDLINFDGMQNISLFLVNLILAIESQNDLMDYQKIQKTAEHSGRGFRIYLGTIPDYASADLIGVKLSGVTKDSPADHAGLKQDDVIVELAGKKIRDIYDYTFVLSALRAGQSVGLIARRGQKSVLLQIVPQSRE